MEFVIKSIGGREIWKGDAETLREAVEKATRQGAYLTRAYLAGANLAGANLTGVYLAGANLAGANLAGADLTGAYLAGADLTLANLTGAYLTGANLTRADLTGAYLTRADLTEAYLTRADLTGANLAAIRDDFRKALDASPNEVLGLRKALRAGNVNGSQYEGQCACLVGTVANIRGCAYNMLGDLKPDADRPAERWFLAIREGDSHRNSEVVRITLGWLDEWLKEKGVKVPKRPKSIGEVERLMRRMPKRQRDAVLAYVYGLTS